MKIRIYLFASALLLASALPLAAQQTPPSCCALKRQAGQNAFDRKQWDEAIKEWDKGLRCSDAEKCPDLSKLIEKAKAEKKKQAAQEEAARKADDDLYGIAESADALAAYEAHIKKCVLCRHKSKAEAAIKRLKGPDPGSAPPAPNPQPPSNMVRVRGGAFDMGDQFGDGDSDETVHRVTVADFYIGRTEVTFEEYDRFCEANGRDKPSDAGWGRGKRPVINVSWYDAIESATG